MKLENILVGSDGHIRLSDWSSALVGKDYSKRLLCSYIRGTKMYAPPEVITQYIASEKSFFAQRQWDATLADVWSTGITIYAMACGRPPFHIATHEDPWFSSFLKETDQEGDMLDLALVSECASTGANYLTCESLDDGPKGRFLWPSCMNPSLVCLLLKMLKVKPEKRCTVAEALSMLKQLGEEVQQAVMVTE